MATKNFAQVTTTIRVEYGKLGLMMLFPNILIDTENGITFAVGWLFWGASITFKCEK